MSRIGRHVVQVVPYFPPHVGGMENVVAAIAEALAGQGSDRVTVLTTDSGAAQLPKHERLGRMEIYRSHCWEYAHTPFAPGLVVRLLMLPRDAVLHVHIAQAIIPELAAVTAKLRRQPFVAHYHLDVDVSGRLGWLFLLYKRFLLGWTLRAATRVIVLTPSQARFIEDTHRVRPENIAILPNGVHPSFFQARRPVPMEGPFRLLFVGRLAAQKNVPLLISALQEVKTDTELVIAGDGDLRPELAALADGSAAKIRFVGTQRRSELLDWYAWADAFVMTSEREGMPLVLLEAMASGLPIIAADAPGISEFVRHDGLLVAPMPSAIAAAIDRLCGDPQLRRTLSTKSSTLASQYSWERLIQRLTMLYDEVFGC